MAWNDLSIAQRSQLINTFRHNGVSSLSEMKRLYDLYSPLEGNVDTYNTTTAPVYAGGGDKGTLNNKRYNSAHERAMYDYLRSGGLNHQQASGLLGNLAVESYLDAEMHQIGGPAYGLMQAEGARKRAMLSYNDKPYLFGSGLSQEEQQQLDYILDKGIDTYTPGEWGRKGFSGARKAREAFKSSSDTREASDIITNNFLRPGKPNLSRRRVMSDYYDDKYSNTVPYNMENWYAGQTAFSDGGSKIHIKPSHRGKFTALKKRTEHFEGDNNNGPRFKKSQEAYYDRDTDTIYAPDSIGEFYHHEMFHARPDSIELERLKPYYENLDDNRLLELGADLPFIKRMGDDPGHFYSPEEVGARVSAAKYMLNNAGINKVDNAFLEEARKNENAYGDNFRDLLHMYNDENLIGIFNNSYSSGGKIYIKPSHRGRFTELKKRTGHSASWFKAHGTPAQRKMATFELNSRHWKHSHGGIKF